MAYRGSRFEAGELKGLEKAWGVVDELEKSGLAVRTEVMAGSSYRRKLTPEAIDRVGDVNYVLQTVFSVPGRGDGQRVSARYFIDESLRILGGLELPGEQEMDKGGLSGLDPDTTDLPFGSTGRTEDDLLFMYAPWAHSRWSEAGRECMAFYGIELPQPKALMEEHPIRWDEREMRQGAIVFEPTPPGLETH